MKIRKLIPSDMEQVLLIQATSFSNPWPEHLVAYYLQHEHYYAFVAAEEDEIIGFIFLSVTDQVEVDRIAVLKEKRNGGVGRKLLQTIFEVAEKEQVAKAFLEVRVSNLPATTLYEKFGFQAIGRRKNYYQDPEEDGILYQRQIEC